MTNEEFQLLVLEKLGSLEAEISGIKSNMATKEDIARLDTKIDTLDTKVERYGQVQQDDVKVILELINSKLDNLPTRNELFSVIAEQQRDIIATLQIPEKKLDSVESVLDVLDVCTTRQEAEIQSIKRIK